MENIEKTFLKWVIGIFTTILTSSLLAFVGFMSLTVFNDHTTIASMSKWQDIYGGRIDTIALVLQNHWHVSTSSIDNYQALNK